MKRCTHCQRVKPLNEFYDAEGTCDGKTSWCKQCMKEKSRKGNSKRAFSTGLGQRILASNGIPTTTGHGAGMPWVDLAAFGCVPVEAKLAKTDSVYSFGGMAFYWGFTPKQRREGIPGYIMFMALGQDGHRSFIVPSSVDWLSNSDGSLRMHAFSALPESDDPRAKNWEFLLPYENAYHLLWAALFDHMGEIIETASVQEYLEERTHGE